jgi:hypothetical protein
MMLYPIWHPLPRPRFFPEDPRLDRLLDSYDRTIGYFKLRMFRRNARDLRKGIFGPKGLRQVPDSGGGVLAFDLPKGWTLRLTYHAAGDYDFERRRLKAGDVEAEFFPPAIRTEPRISRNGPRTSREEGLQQPSP